MTVEEDDAAPATFEGGSVDLYRALLPYEVSCNSQGILVEGNDLRGGRKSVCLLS